MEIKQSKLFEYLAENPEENIDVKKMLEYCFENNSEFMNKLISELSTVNKIPSVNKVNTSDIVIDKQNIISSQELNKLSFDDYGKDISKEFEPKTLSNDEYMDLYASSDWSPRVVTYSKNNTKNVNKEFINIVRTNHQVRNIIRSVEIFNLVTGKTNKPSINGHVTFDDLLGILVAKYNTTNSMKVYSAINTVIENIIKVNKEDFEKNKELANRLFDEIEDLKEELTEVLEGKKKVTLVELDNLKNTLQHKERNYDKYRMYHGYNSYDEKLFYGLKIPKELEKKYQSRLIAVPDNERLLLYSKWYLLDYFCRFIDYVEDLWKEAIRDNSECYKNLGDSEPLMKLLYAIVRGWLSKHDKHFNDDNGLIKLAKIFGRKKFKYISKGMKVKYLELLKALGINQYDKNTTLSKVYKSMYKKYISDISFFVFIDIRMYNEYVLTESSIPVNKFESMHSILDEALGYLLLIED